MTVFHHIHGKGVAETLSKGDFRVTFENGKVSPIIKKDVFQDWLNGPCNRTATVRVAELIKFFEENNIEYNIAGTSTTNGFSQYFTIGDWGRSLKIRVSNHSIGDRRATVELDYVGFEIQRQRILEFWNDWKNHAK